MTFTNLASAPQKIRDDSANKWLATTAQETDYPVHFCSCKHMTSVEDLRTAVKNHIIDRMKASRHIGTLIMIDRRRAAQVGVSVRILSEVSIKCGSHMKHTGGIHLIELP